jgi:arginyl-tRNA synthetase
VLRKLEQFPEIVERSAGELLPNLTANYLFELAQMLNSFYQNVSILQEPDVPLKTFRLSLISATAQVLKNGLNLLGIEAPEEM